MLPIFLTVLITHEKEKAKQKRKQQNNSAYNRKRILVGTKAGS